MTALVVGKSEPVDNIFTVLNKLALDTGPMYAKSDILEGKTYPEDPAIKRPTNRKEALNGHAIQSIEFSREMSILDALRFLGVTYQKNIVPSPNVEGQLTITNLYNVTFEEALEAVIGKNKYEVKGNFIRIYTPEEYTTRDRLETEVFVLHYVSAEEAKNLINPVLSDLGDVATTTPAERGTDAGHGGDSLTIRDRIIVSDLPDNLEKVRAILSNVDIMPPQILIEVTLLEAELDESTEYGIDFDILGLTTQTPGTVALGDDAMSVGGFATGVATGGLSLGIVKDHVRIFIRALEGITDTTVIARPKILALNKQAGKIHIGNRDGYRTVTTVSDGGTSVQSVEFLETGTLLQFRPFICDNDNIRLEINPERSEGGINDDSLPWETTTEVKSNIMVKDGRTVVIGGLFKDKTDLSRSQVPLVGDIPVVGEAFKKVKDQVIRTELIVLITPHIIHDPSNSNGDARMADVMRLMHDAKTNITWLSRTRRAEDRYAKAVEYYTNGNLDKALTEINWIWEERTDLNKERLREKIIKQTSPDDYNTLRRIMYNKMKNEYPDRWQRF